MLIKLSTNTQAYSEENIQSLIGSFPLQVKESLSMVLISKRRREQALTYHLLQELLIENGILGDFPIITHTASGQPILKNYSFFLSISHSKDSICVALDEYPIGIDIETVRPLNENLMNRAFSPTERQTILSAQEPNSEFVRLWTRKEAFLKQQGLGIKGFDQLQSSPPQSAYLFSLRKENLWISICSEHPLSEWDIRSLL